MCRQDREILHMASLKLVHIQNDGVSRSEQHVECENAAGTVCYETLRQPPDTPGVTCSITAIPKPLM